MSMNDQLKSITLVCTVHRENGAASASNLYKILEQIEPEVIFLEISPDDFENYYTAPGLEPKAVIQYKRNRQVTLVAVDMFIADRNILMNFQRLFEVIDANSTTAYQQKNSDMQSCVYVSGFSYLNSDQCSKDHAELNSQDLETIRKINDPEITSLYEYWNAMISRRQNEMINGVFGYSRKNTFNKAIFLVGAAHRDSIIKKSEGYKSHDTKSIQWHCYP